MENQGLERATKPVLEQPLDREILKENTNGQEAHYFLRTNIEEGNIVILDDNKKEVGKLLFAIDNADPEKIRILHVKIYPEARGSNLGIELYKGLISLAQNNSLNGILSDTSVSFGASLIWKKLKDEGYDMTVNPEAQGQYDEFLKQYEAGEKNMDQYVSIKGIRGAVFQITL